MERAIKPLTGQDLVQKIRSKNTGRVVLYVFFLLGTLLMLAGAVACIREASFILGIVMVLAAGVLMWYCWHEIKKALETLKNVSNSKLFRKFGDPETMAERISSGRTEPVYTNRNTLVGRDYIMKFGDFESYKPMEDIVLMYRKEHRTNGVLDGVFLVCYDCYGESVDYPFPQSKKHSGEMELVIAAIMQYAPNCMLGYTQQNLSAVKQNARPIPGDASGL